MMASKSLIDFQGNYEALGAPYFSSNIFLVSSTLHACIQMRYIQMSIMFIVTWTLGSYYFLYCDNNYLQVVTISEESWN